MAIDFRLTSHQRELRLESRKFAADVLANASAAELLPTPEERFRATKPVYEAMVAAGFLRKCIPIPAGGDNAGLIDMAIMAEEFYSVNASITLTMLGTVLGLLPILLAGTPEQAGRLVKPFLKKSGAPLAGFCSTEPGGSANAAAPLPGEGVRTVAELRATTGSSMAGKNGCPPPPGGIVKELMFYALCAERMPAPRQRKAFQSLWSNDLLAVSSSNAQSIR